VTSSSTSGSPRYAPPCCRWWRWGERGGRGGGGYDAIAFEPVSGGVARSPSAVKRAELLEARWRGDYPSQTTAEQVELAAAEEMAAEQALLVEQAAREAVSRSQGRPAYAVNNIWDS